MFVGFAEGVYRVQSAQYEVVSSLGFSVYRLSDLRCRVWSLRDKMKP